MNGAVNNFASVNGARLFIANVLGMTVIAAAQGREPRMSDEPLREMEKERDRYREEAVRLRQEREAAEEALLAELVKAAEQNGAGFIPLRLLQVEEERRKRLGALHRHDAATLKPLLDALAYVRSEIRAILAASREEIRESAGNTNLRCLEMAAENTESLLRQFGRLPT